MTEPLSREKIEEIRARFNEPTTPEDFEDFESLEPWVDGLKEDGRDLLSELDRLTAELASAKAEGKREGVEEAAKKCREIRAANDAQAALISSYDGYRALKLVVETAERCERAIRSLLTTDTPTPKDTQNG